MNYLFRRSSRNSDLTVPVGRQFLIGERKRKLTSAVLSDTHGMHTKKGEGLTEKRNIHADQDDIGAIGRILQKSLLRSKMLI